jgi:alginate O-acetyltransferase complex protein AlgI
MLFTTWPFVFVFLPATLVIVSFAIRVAGRSAGIAALIAASLVFYGYWKWSGVILIAASIALNFTVAQGILKSSTRWRKPLLAVGVIADLSVLACYKYANFFAVNAGISGSTAALFSNIVLPLGLSFYTFQQIAFIVDTYNGKVKADFRNYAIAVTFFPHLIAGPLVHYRNIIGQFQTTFGVSWAYIFAGLPIFIVGLVKKTFIADNVALLVDPIFARAENGPVEFFSSWTAALGYTVQLYFDFSGYSDMAIGLAAMFGIALPVNFFSPYKATSIIDFWRRWHITLSEFLRDYLYIPLGGNRSGSSRRYVNLMIVMTLGGLWHGAGWNFVAWGFLHGVLLMVNNLWRWIVGGRIDDASFVMTPIYWMATFLSVVVGWVLFRAGSFVAFNNLFAGMTGRAGFVLPPEVATLFHIERGIPGIVFSYTNSLLFGDYVSASILIWGFLCIAWFAPNSAEIFGLDRKTPRLPSMEETTWSTAGPAASIVYAWLYLFSLFTAASSPFIYFQF